MNWMRVSGLGKFRKLYGVLDMSLVKGRKLQIRANSQYPTKEFGARKALVIMTQQWTGEPQSGLGIVFIVAGVLSCLLGCFFLWLFLSRPHHLASIEFLDWAGAKRSAPETPQAFSAPLPVEQSTPAPAPAAAVESVPSPVIAAPPVATTSEPAKAQPVANAVQNLVQEPVQAPTSGQAGYVLSQAEKDALEGLSARNIEDDDGPKENTLFQQQPQAETPTCPACVACWK